MLQQSIAFQNLVQAVSTLEGERSAAVAELASLRRNNHFLREENAKLLQLIHDTESGALREQLDTANTDLAALRSEMARLQESSERMQQQAQWDHERFDREYQELLATIQQRQDHRWTADSDNQGDGGGERGENEIGQSNAGRVAQASKTTQKLSLRAITFDLSTQTEEAVAIQAEGPTTLSSSTGEKQRPTSPPLAQHNGVDERLTSQPQQQPQQQRDIPRNSSCVLAIQKHYDRATQTTPNSSERNAASSSSPTEALSMWKLEFELQEARRSLSRQQTSHQEALQVLHEQLDRRDRERFIEQQRLEAEALLRAGRKRTTGVQTRAVPIQHASTMTTTAVPSAQSPAPQQEEQTGAQPMISTSSALNSGDDGPSHSPLTQAEKPLLSDAAKNLYEKRLRELQQRVIQLDTALLIEQEAHRLLDDRCQSLTQQLIAMSCEQKKNRSSGQDNGEANSNNSNKHSWEVWISQLRQSKAELERTLATTRRERDDLQRQTELLRSQLASTETHFAETTQRLDEQVSAAAQCESALRDVHLQWREQTQLHQSEMEQHARKERSLQADLKITQEMLSESRVAYQRDVTASRGREETLREQIKKLSATLRTVQESAVVSQYRHERAVVSATAFETMKTELDTLRNEQQQQRVVVGGDGGPKTARSPLA